MPRALHPTESCWPLPDRRRLQQALRKTRLARDYRRIEVVLWIAEGLPVAEAAQRAHMGLVSAFRWREFHLQSRDPAALSDHRRGGRPPMAPGLTDALLAELLAQDPRVHGHCATGWTAPLLVQHLRQCHGNRVGERTLRRRLHRFGFRWKRPHDVFSHRAAHLPQKKGASSAG